MHDASGQPSVGWSETGQQIAGELTQAIQLRRDLAELEIRHDRALLKRFMFVGGSAAALVLTGVPLLLTATAWWLAQRTELSVAGWLILFATVLVVPGAVVLVLGIRKLRSEFCGLQSTRAELREDLAWVREWANQGRADSPRSPTSTAP